MTIEEPLYKLRPNRIAFIKEYFLALLLILFIFLISSIISVNIIGIMAVVFLIIIFLLSPEISRIRNKYFITKSQVVVEEGIVSKKRNSIFMDSIANVSVEQNYIQRILKVGSIIIDSRAGKHTRLKLDKIRRPRTIAHEIEILIKEYGKKK